MTREWEIDVLRGFCVTMMIPFHLLMVRLGVLAFSIGFFEVVAEGFVFLAGWSAGRYFIGRFKKNPRKTSIYFLRRAGKFYLIQMAILLSIAAFMIPLGRWTVSDYPGFFLNLFALQIHPFYLTLLVMFIGFALLTPPALWLLNKKNGRFWLLGISLAVFVFSQFFPYDWAITTDRAFPVRQWQFFYFSGMFFASLINEYGTLSQVKARRWLRLVWPMVLIFGVLRAYGFLGLIPGQPFMTGFNKHPLEFGRYFSLLAWILFYLLAMRAAGPSLRRIFLVKWLEVVGQHALLGYALHCWALYVGFAVWGMHDQMLFSQRIWLTFIALAAVIAGCGLWHFYKSGKYRIGTA